MAEGILIFYSSPNGRNSWSPVLPADIPSFIKEAPDVIGKMVDGEMCMDAASDSMLWYRVEQVDTPTAQTELGAVY